MSFVLLIRVLEGSPGVVFWQCKRKLHGKVFQYATFFTYHFQSIALVTIGHIKYALDRFLEVVYKAVIYKANNISSSSQ